MRYLITVDSFPVEFEVEADNEEEAREEAISDIEEQLKDLPLTIKPYPKQTVS